MTVKTAAVVALSLSAFAFASTAQAAPNILLIIGDDIGVETMASYGLAENVPSTPNLDEMARNGLRLNNFWSQPVCSPTRATIVTGRYAFRTGVGRPVSKFGPVPENPVHSAGGGGGGGGGGAGNPLRAIPRNGLPSDEFTLPSVLAATTNPAYATAAIGKWHLADADNGWFNHPNIVGFDHFSGGWGGSTESYHAWNKLVNGEVSSVTGYTPTDKIDDALSWIDAQGEAPWFMWLGFNLPHTPLHTPPDYIEFEPEEGFTNIEDFDAMIETMDQEIGRLLQEMDPSVRDNTYIIFMGDNGTPGGTLRPPVPQGRGKGSVYRGGINVPFIVTGPDVPQGSVSEALVNSADLFVTIMELAGLDPEQIVPEEVVTDSVSFRSTLSAPESPSNRDWIFVDEFFGNFAGVETANYAIRNERYKLLRSGGVVEFYDLQNDPWEASNLLDQQLSAAQQAAFDELQDQVHELRSGG